MLTCTKTFPGVPFAHRQPWHIGHCKLVHGHNWTIEATFQADRLDENGFVVDFGNLGYLKNWIAAKLDHALLIVADDPELELFRKHDGVLWNMTVVENGSAEKLAEWILGVFDSLTEHQFKDRDVRVIKVVIWESECNSATAVRAKIGAP